MPRSVSLRRLFAFTHDIGASGAAWLAAFWLRFNLEIPPEYLRVALYTLPSVLVVNTLVFWSLGLYRGLWRYASLPDLQRIVLATAVASLALPAVVVLLPPPIPVPRSVFLIAPLLLVGAMSGSRLLYRAWKEGRLLGIVRRPQADPVIVLGAGTAGAALLRDLQTSSQWRVVALLDDDPTKRGGAIHDVKVLGPLEQVGPIAERMGVTQAIIAMPGANHEARKRALDLCEAAGLRVMTVPAYSDIIAGRVKVSQLREVELDDLLGRDPVRLDDALLSGFLKDKTVLVTGAGGSIGSELCRQIACFAPGRLVLLENSEFALYSVEQEFRDRYPGIPIVPTIGDAKDELRVREVFSRHSPRIVFHAAAYKHVPLMEGENALQAVANNARSTIVTARAAQAAGTETYVLVSTDKAVNPTNVMGASKRLAEMLCQSLQSLGTTHFVMVRFGNVLGSTGSVIPRFRQQIARGGPVTVTDPNIERFFMSIPEAAQLVLQAALMGKGGEIFVLDMGEPVKIADLARRLIRLSGFTEQDISVVYTGLRPGEKLYEEVLANEESTLPTPHPKLRVAKARSTASGSLPEEVLGWLDDTPAATSAAVRARLKAWIPEYAPGSTSDPMR
jgi:FlaA1/EpsC-like NDP-sugar epimerase